MKKIILLAVAGLALAFVLIFQLGFNSVGTLNRSKLHYEWVDTAVSENANKFFWEQFHLGHYDSIPAILDTLTKAYLDNPNDLQTVYHLGFTHFWAISERHNFSIVSSTIVDHAVLAQKYLGEAYRMNPKDARILSFLSAAKIIVGEVSQDKNLVREGYFNGLRSIRKWKDFGQFSLAYTLSQVPHNDPNFRKAIKWMEKTTERCYCQDPNPLSKECVKFIAQEIPNPKTLGKNRIVPNSWVAPHNIEGYFMSYGDLLVKNGEWEKAISIYELAKHAPDYINWPYRNVLETRIQHAEENVKKFRNAAKSNEILGLDDAVMVQTGMSCRACHQMSPSELITTYDKFDPEEYLDKSFYFLE